MITEEQLRDILNSLRVNAYDTPEYEIVTSFDEHGAHIRIENRETKNCIWLGVYHTKTRWIFNKRLDINCKPFAIIEKFTINNSGTVDNIKISEDLYDNFYTYLKERSLQDRFIVESNVNSEFNL